MYYTASSVKEALNTKSEGELGCPLKKIRNISSNERRLINCKEVCYGNLSNCIHVPRKCKQWIYVETKKGERTLYFYFPISENCPEGTIEEQDSSLQTLIKEGLINPNLLKAA